ncbi:cadherin-like beta sandwich domain-containing protein [Paenibacillus lutrae]|uniref:GAP1-N2 domain-containing protein n=1 Tax=Paenibacillus lutrae TaxID=2078573 RepID=UPI001911570D
MTGRKLQQQLFTRDREGIFRTSEGFDTVAKSPGLDGSFIKSALHPYCVYKPPQELLERGEENSSLYPESLVSYQAENGDLVIGRSVYVATDFTGQRSASFTHQFVVPKESKEAFIREPRRIFGIRAFRSRYDIREGKSVPELELDELAYDGMIQANQEKELLEELGIGRELFRQLVYAVLSAAAGKKKVYIALDTGVSRSGEYAGRLLEIIYRCLPYAARRLLGFMTFNSEPEAKQNLHVVFTEKGSIRLPDRRLEKDYIFDFPNARFMNAELPAQELAYLDFVWDHRSEPRQLQGLLDFCDEALAGMDAGTSLSPAAYSKLCTLYDIEQGNEKKYEGGRAATMNAILSFLSADTVPLKPRLNQLFLRLLSREASDRHSVLDAEYLEAVIRYEKIADTSARTLLVRCLGIFISRAAAAVSSGGTDGSVPLLDLLAKHAGVFSAVLREVLQGQPQIAENYVRVRMKRVSSVQDFTDEISFWLAAGESFATGEFFLQEAYEPMKRIMRGDVRRKIGQAKLLAGYFDGLSRSGKQAGAGAVPAPGGGQSRPDASRQSPLAGFSRWMKLAVQLELLDDLQPAHLGWEDLSGLGFLLEPLSPDLRRHADARQNGALRVLLPLYKALARSGEDQREAEEELGHLDTVDLDRVQGLLRKLLQTQLTSASFGRIATAFYRPGNGTGGQDLSYQPAYDYEGMLNYVADHTRGTETLYDFLLWSADDSRFLIAQTQAAAGDRGIHPHYKAAVSRTFDVHAPQAFKNKGLARRLLAVNNDTFRALFETIKLRQSGKLARIWAKNKRRIILRGSILLVLLVAVTALIWKPVAAWLTPPPVLVIEAPEKAGEQTVSVKMSLQEPDQETKLYVNDKEVGKGTAQAEVPLSEGPNEVVFKAVNAGGKESGVVRKTITLVAAPLLKVEPLPASVRTSSVVVAVKAEDSTDPSPEIFINGQSVGFGSVSRTVELNPGENEIEITAKNKYGRTSEPMLYKVKAPGSGSKKADSNAADAAGNTAGAAGNSGSAAGNAAGSANSKPELNTR